MPVTSSIRRSQLGSNTNAILEAHPAQQRTSRLMRSIDRVKENPSVSRAPLTSAAFLFSFPPLLLSSFDLLFLFLLPQNAVGHSVFNPSDWTCCCSACALSAPSLCGQASVGKNTALVIPPNFLNAAHRVGRQQKPGCTLYHYGEQCSDTDPDVEPVDVYESRDHRARLPIPSAAHGRRPGRRRRAFQTPRA